MRNIEIDQDILIQSDVREGVEAGRQIERRDRYFSDLGKQQGIKPATLHSLRVGDIDQVVDDAQRGRVSAAAVETFILVAERDGFMPCGMHVRFAKRYRFFEEASSNEAGFGWNR